MRVVVADTTPLRYLAEIEHLELLPQLFTTIYIPTIVYEELQQPSTPATVRSQLGTPPSWLKIVATQDDSIDPDLLTLDEGEKAALLHGLNLKADLTLIDERRGASVARQKGLEITGTLGILVRAAKRDLVTLSDAFDRLQRTKFYCPPELMTALLAEHK